MTGRQPSRRKVWKVARAGDDSWREGMSDTVYYYKPDGQWRIRPDGSSHAWFIQRQVDLHTVGAPGRCLWVNVAEPQRTFTEAMDLFADGQDMGCFWTRDTQRDLRLPRRLRQLQAERIIREAG